MKRFVKSGACALVLLVASGQSQATGRGIDLGLAITFGDINYFPNNSDVDNDGISNQDDADIDGDLVSNDDEAVQGTNPFDRLSYLDTDGDFVPNTVELADGTNNFDATSFRDSDGDGLPDYLDNSSADDSALVPSEEDTDFNFDLDDDGVPNFIELLEGTSPFDENDFADYDNDNIPNFLDADDDNDGLTDIQETLFGLNRLDSVDALQDHDQDGLSTLVEFQNQLNPLDGTDASADFDGDGVANDAEINNQTNPFFDDVPPTITGEHLILNASGRLTQVFVPRPDTRDVINGVEQVCCFVEAISDFEVLGHQFWRSGGHIIEWLARDESGNEAAAEQLLIIFPQVSFQQNQAIAEGQVVELDVFLSGEAPYYPIHYPFVVTGTATAGDHSLSDGVVTFTEDSPLKQTISFTVTEDFIAEPDETIVVSWGDPLAHSETANELYVQAGLGVNAGAKAQVELLITDDNLPPSIEFSVSQGDREDVIFVDASSSEFVTITFSVDDPNPEDVLTITHADLTQLGITDLNAAPDVIQLNPAQLNNTYFWFEVQVMDSGSPPLVASEFIYLHVLDEVPALAQNQDSDGDGIDDLLEGDGDSDRDGLPNYLDNESKSNILALQNFDTNSYAHSSEGTRLRLNALSSLAEAGGIAIEREHAEFLELPEDTAHDTLDYLYDFIVAGLKTPGDSAQVVIPLLASLPQGAVYRKLDFFSDEWVDFEVDSKNQIHTAFGEGDECPPVGSAIYLASPGLTPGHNCLQLTIEDGGPNDDDGVANTMVFDPGTVAIPLDVIAPSGFTVAFLQTDIASDNPVVDIQITAAAEDIGATYVLNISSSAGGTTLSLSGSVSATTVVRAGVDLSRLLPGELTATLILRDASGNVGSQVASLQTATLQPSPAVADEGGAGDGGSAAPDASGSSGGGGGALGGLTLLLLLCGWLGTLAGRRHVG